MGDALALAREGATAEATAFGDRRELRLQTPRMDEASSAPPRTIVPPRVFATDSVTSTCGSARWLVILRQAQPMSHDSGPPTPLRAARRRLRRCPPRGAMTLAHRALFPFHSPGGGLPCRTAIGGLPCRPTVGGGATCKRVNPGGARPAHAHVRGWNGGCRAAPRDHGPRIHQRILVPNATCRHVRSVHLPVKSMFFRGCKWRSRPLGRAPGGCRPHLTAALVVLHDPAGGPCSSRRGPACVPPRLNARGREVSVLHPAPVPRRAMPMPPLR